MNAGAFRVPEVPGPSWSRAVTVALGLVAGGAVALLSWARNRGFDLTDEGFYYVVFAHPEQIVAYHDVWDYTLGSAIFRALGSSISRMRVATLAVQAGSAALFSWGLLAFLGPWWPGLQVKQGGRPAVPVDLRWQMSLLLFLSGLPITWMPAALAYNQANAAALLTATGCLLGAAARAHGPGGATRWLLVGSGIATSIALAAKFSSGVAFVACAVAVILLPARWGGSSRPAAAGAYLLGIAGGWSLFFLPFGGPTRHWSVFRDGLAALATLGGHPIGATLRRYGREVVELASFAVRQQAPALLILGVSAILARHRESSGRRSGPVRRDGAWAAVVLAFAAAIAGVLLRGDGLGASMAHPYPGLVAVAACTAVLTRSFRSSRRWRKPDAAARERMALLSLVLVLPILAVVGTGNPISLNICFQAAPWWAIGLVLTVTAGKRVSPTGLPALFLLGASVLLAVQLVHGRVLAPYRLPAPLLDATEPVAIGLPPSEIQLDPRSARFVREVQASFARCDFRPGMDVLAFFHLPGLVHAVGGVAPGYPWLPAGYPGSDRFIRDRLASIADERASAAFVVEDDAAGSARLLEGRGLLFPGDYGLCGAVDSPYTSVQVRIWRPARQGR